MPILDIDAVGCDLTRTHFSQTKATASLFESGFETQRNVVVIHDRLLQEILKSLDSSRMFPAQSCEFCPLFWISPPGGRILSSIYTRMCHYTGMLVRKCQTRCHTAHCYYTCFQLSARIPRPDFVTLFPIPTMILFH